MRYPITLILLLVLSSCLWGQADAPAGCSKNVSFAIAEGGQPVPAIPKFALKWLGGKSRKEGFSTLCFSQVPSLTQTNYMVVFSTTPVALEGLKASAHTYKNGSQGHDNPVNSYSGTWSYLYAGNVPAATTSTMDLRRDDKPKSLEARAFDQSGKTVTQASLTTSSSRDKLLEKVMADIAKDSVPPEARKSFASQLPVYYVNCDVEGQPVSPLVEAAANMPAKAAPAPAPAPAPVAADPPSSELEIWSYPAGADVFLDGAYVGQTPYTQAVPLGPHTIDLRKKNFAIWQRKVQAMPGKRRIGGNLEQKILNLQ